MAAIEGYSLRQILLFSEQAQRQTALSRAALCLDVNLEGKAAQKHIKALEDFAHGR